MTNCLNLILQSLKDSNYLKGVCIAFNGKIRCESTLLENGLKLREQLLTQLISTTTNWTTQCGGIREINKNPVGNEQISFLQRIEFQKSHQNLYNEKLVNMANSIAWKLMSNKNSIHFDSADNLFYGSITKNMLVTDVFVAAENDLFKYNSLQREHKVWWMKFSANPSRFCVEPCHISSGADNNDEMYKNSKLMSIKAKYVYGSADVENIYLIPLPESPVSVGHFGKISLIRSVINLDLATSALILDSSMYRSNSKNFTLMLNRKLAPHQILLANFHNQNKTVDELTTHLEHVIGRSGLRLYDNCVHTSLQVELEEKLLQSDSMGIPYVLLIDEESTKSGLMRMRSRDTTLFETIHISDIPHYLINNIGH